MKNILCETENVRKANSMLNRMEGKKGADMTLIYGHPGTGKSHFAIKNFAQNGWGYHRLSTMETPKMFLREIYRSLILEMTGKESVIHVDSGTLARATIELFQEISYQRERLQNKKPYIFFIDEINLAIQNRKWQIVELIRDFRDIANAKIIMIGEEDTKKRLERYNSHFFNRCSNFCEFDITSTNEMINILIRTMEVEAEKEAIYYIIKESKGSLHSLEAKIKDFELIAKRKNISKLTLKDILDSIKED